MFRDISSALGGNLGINCDFIEQFDLRRGIPDYNYTAGTIKFFRKPPPRSGTPSEKADDASFDAFQGEGTSLRQAKSNK